MDYIGLDREEFMELCDQFAYLWEKVNDELNSSVVKYLMCAFRRVLRAMRWFCIRIAGIALVVDDEQHLLFTIPMAIYVALFCTT